MGFGNIWEQFSLSQYIKSGKKPGILDSFCCEDSSTRGYTIAETKGSKIKKKSYSLYWLLIHVISLFHSLVSLASCPEFIDA